MSLRRRLECWLGWHSTYRERRALAGVQVQHFICHDCGHAVPVMKRSEAEYRHVAKSQLPALKAKPVLQPSASERARALEQIRPKVSA